MSSIILELQARLTELERENETLREKLYSLTHREESLSQSFSIEGERLISGIGLAAGCWNGKEYTEEVVRNCPDFTGVPLKVEHGDTEEFGDKTVGRVVKWEWDETLKAWKFIAEVEDDTVWEMVKEGRFKSVSPNFIVEYGEVDGKEVIMSIDKPIELSLTTTPACSVCHITSVQENLSESNEEESVEVIEMSKRVYAWVILPREELEQLAVKKKVVVYYPLPTGYYYYYRYPYPYYYAYPYAYPRLSEEKMSECRVELHLDTESALALLTLTEEEFEELRGRPKVAVIYYYYGYYPYAYPYAYPPPVEPVEKKEEEEQSQVTMSEEETGEETPTQMEEESTELSEQPSTPHSESTPTQETQPVEETPTPSESKPVEEQKEESTEQVVEEKTEETVEEEKEEDTATQPTPSTPTVQEQPKPKISAEEALILLLEKRYRR